MDIEWFGTDYIHYITNETKKHNLDNISRTHAYQNFYFKYPDIKWAFVASMVSRNAGWNMTDLFLPPFQSMLSEMERSRLFMTYERANWLIFSDAYPQLLTYQISIKIGKPLFYLLKDFHVSKFMIQEWYNFWKYNDKERLLSALIINEQNVIQAPVIKQSYFKNHVFLKLPYLLQDYFLMNAVLLPNGNSNLYGEFVHDFTKVTKRITLGKKIAAIIYHENVYANLVKFAKATTHTGSRIDYERYFNQSFPKGPYLRTIYPAITHQDMIRKDWYNSGKVKDGWFKPTEPNTRDIGSSFYKKRNLLFAYHHIKSMFT